MQIEVKLDPAYREPKIMILTDSMTEEVQQILQALSADAPQIISGVKDGMVEVLEETDLIHLYASSGKVFAVTGQGTYAIRPRLYELEERLDKSRFVRISNSEIINLKKVRHFDLSIAGTICVKLSNGTVTYVSRRYVRRIKEILGI